MSEAVRADPRGPGSHQALPGGRRQPGRRPGARRGPGALPPRRERRGQEHAREHRVRAVPARRGTDPPARRARRVRQLARRDRRRDRDGAPALPAHPGVHGGREHRARQRAAARPGARPRPRPRAHPRAEHASTASRSTPTPWSRRCRSASSSASSSIKALYRDADILILDEPTAVLTPGEVDEFFGVVRSLVEQGKSIIFITHKLREVLAVADHIVVLRGGEVVGTADPADRHAAVPRHPDGRDGTCPSPSTRRRPPAASRCSSVTQLWVDDDRGVDHRGRLRPRGPRRRGVRHRGRRGQRPARAGRGAHGDAAEAPGRRGDRRSQRHPREPRARSSTSASVTCPRTAASTASSARSASPTTSCSTATGGARSPGEACATTTPSGGTPSSSSREFDVRTPGPDVPGRQPLRRQPAEGDHRPRARPAT